ncbi:MAG TPA: prolyl oligopeptidase family serine peptidase [Candidatus Babeliales bacterium]|nr:prolyl oligopeptidase family serine peptidase [Candidatus Babeliales bacterium]
MIATANTNRSPDKQPWVEVDQKKCTSWLFAHGLFASPAQAALYGEPIKTSTHEIAKRSKKANSGITVLQGIRTSTCTFAETQFKPQKRLFLQDTFFNSLYRIALAPLKLPCYALTICAHRLLGVQIEQQACLDSSMRMYWINLLNINIGQQADLHHLSVALQQHSITMHAQEPDLEQAVIIYGVSRGSAAAFCFQAIEKNPEVRAVIAESLLDTFPNLIKTSSFIRRFLVKTVLLMSAFLRKTTLARYTHFYDPSGISPLDLLEHFPKETALLLITSLTDTAVPCQSTQAMYKALRKSGHTKVHLLVLKHSSHPGYTFDNQEDRTMYERVVHAFNRHYGLAHIPSLAQEGQQFFELTQPDPNSLQ